MQKRLLFILLLFLPLFAKGQILKERRVYYIDCSYSMKQNGIWDLVRDKLKDAIDEVNDETTEILVCPYAFDKKSSVKSEVKTRGTVKGLGILKILSEKFREHGIP